MAESPNDIMARGGANSDSLRLQSDLAAVDAWAGPKDMNAAVVAYDDSLDNEDEDAEEDDDTAVQDEVQTAAKWPKGQPLESLQTHQYRNNSPTKCKRQRTSGKSAAWQVVKRLTDPALAGGHWTHVCIVCRRLVRCNKNKKTQNWVSTNAHNHVVTFKCMEEEQAQEEIELCNKLEEDFGKHFENYVLACEEINWKSVDGVEVPDHRPMIWKDLWKAKMGHVMKVHFLSKDEDGNKYGFLPKMAAIASRGSIGALMAASFCERINSCSNLVVTEGNSVLGPDLVEKVVMLRMNQGFIEMMRREYPHALTLKYPKLGTIVSPEDNAEDTEPSDKAPLRDCDME